MHRKTPPAGPWVQNSTLLYESRTLTGTIHYVRGAGALPASASSACRRDGQDLLLSAGAVAAPEPYSGRDRVDNATSHISPLALTVNFCKGILLFKKNEMIC